MCKRLCRPVLLLCTLLLNSCVSFVTPSEPSPSAAPPAQADCSSVVEEKLEAFPFLSATDAALIWIQDQYHIEASDIQGGASGDGRGDYHYWWIGTRRFDISRRFAAQDTVVIRVRWDVQAPSFAQALRCLGAPPLCRGYFARTAGGPSTCLELWYPERGIMATGCVHGSVSGMTMDQAVGSISYVQPGSPEDLILRFFPDITRDSDVYLLKLNGLMRWPGDIELITIDQWG